MGWLADERRQRYLKADARRWLALLLAGVRRSAELDAAEARSCAAPVWEEQPLLQAGARMQRGLRQLSRADAPRLLEEPKEAAMPAFEDIARRVLLPACGPK